VNEPQVWTIIGVFAATLVTLVTVVSQRFLGSVESLKTEMVLRFEHQDEKFSARFDGIDERMGRLEGRMDRLEVRMDKIEVRIDKLEKQVEDIDRDVQAITKRVLPE